MYVRFMEGRIRYFELLESREHSPEPPVPVGPMDFHNTELALVFAHLPDWPELKSRLQDLDIDWDYEQLHLVTWFAGQVSVGREGSSRIRPNHSARVAYQRLPAPHSLLWIAASLGENNETLQRSANLAETRQTFREKSVLIRNQITFRRIYDLALPLVKQERKRKQAGLEQRA